MSKLEDYTKKAIEFAESNSKDKQEQLLLAKGFDAGNQATNLDKSTELIIEALKDTNRKVIVVAVEEKGGALPKNLNLGEFKHSDKIVKANIITRPIRTKNDKFENKKFRKYRNK